VTIQLQNAGLFGRFFKGLPTGGDATGPSEKELGFKTTPDRSLDPDSSSEKQRLLTRRTERCIASRFRQGFRRLRERLRPPIAALWQPIAAGKYALD